MPELTRGPAPWPELHLSSCKGVFPACVSPGLRLVECARDIVDLSDFVPVDSAFICLQVAVSPTARFLNNFSNQDDTT